MGLYDSYKLSNSTAIPMFEGSAGDDFIKVGQYKQGLYDQTQQSFNDISNQAGEVSSILPQDQELVKQLREGTQQKIEGLAKQGNLEDMAPQARQIGQEFANRSHEIQGPQTQAAEFKKSLENKELNLTPEQKEAVYGNALRNYKGLQVNARGQFVGSFNGKEAAKNIDVNEFVDKALKDVVTQKNGHSYETTQDGAMWIIKNGVKTEIVDPKTLKTVLDAAKQNSTEYQAFKEMQGDVATYHASKFTDPSVTPEGPLKNAAIAATTKYGIPFSSAYQLVAKEATLNHVENQASIYGLNKYNKNDKETEMGIKDNPYTLKDHDKSIAGPFMIQGPNNKLTDDEKDISKVVKTMNDSKTDLINTQANIDRLIKDNSSAGINPSTKTQNDVDIAALTNKKNVLEDQSRRSQSLIDYNNLKTAKKMGYKDYEDFKNRNSKPLEDNIRSLYPNGIPTNSGKVISAAEIADASIDGRIHKVQGQGGYDNGVSITLKDGTTLPLPLEVGGNKLRDKLDQVYLKSGNTLEDFNQNAKKNYQNNVNKMSIQSTNIGIDSEETAKVLKNLLITNNDNVRFSNPGQLNKVSAPDNFRVVSWGTAGVGSDTKLQVEELDKDGKPTGKTYDATTANSNISEELGRHIARSNTPEALEAADATSAGSGAREINRLIPGISINTPAVSKDGKVIQAKIKMIRDSDTEALSYELIDEDGNVLRSTPSANTAGTWLDEFNHKDTYSNGRRKTNLK